MHLYLIRRFFSIIFTLLAVSFITFSLMNVLPGGTAETILKQMAVGIDEKATTGQIQEISSRYNLDKPIIVQYEMWLENLILKGDLGRSYSYNMPVTDLLLSRLPATLLLACTSILIVTIAGVFIGLYTALHEGSLSDQIIRVLTVFGVSFPGFWVALLLIIIFSLTLKLTPTSGYGSIQFLILPAIALSISPSCVIIRLMRCSVLETLQEPFIRYAIAKGMSWSSIVKTHLSRNAFLPVLTVLGVHFGYMFSMTMIIETIFAWPGIGSLLIAATIGRDIP
ncbi:MAG TPA: ABC transporter permease, partial [Methanospirillum sp.]|uniref:ABC transporter permease n=1 Tax=Methanospirillum sp. TaxID=45200 RepID=UPI002B9BB2A0